MGAPDVAKFLSWLATERHVSASSQNQALSALLFLYKDVLHADIGPVDRVIRAVVPKRLPVVLSRQEYTHVMNRGPLGVKSPADD